VTLSDVASGYLRLSDVVSGFSRTVIPMPIDYSRRHLQFGWWSLFVFAGLGLLLESLHGFKIGAYLDVSNETRRLMWRLAHAHGTLLGAVHILFGLMLGSLGDASFRNVRSISLLLMGASVFLPVGFFVGGIGFFGGDPGLGVLLVPAGAVLLLAGLFLVASGLRTARPLPRTPRPKGSSR
jgi:hypothetical protein